MKAITRKLKKKFNDSSTTSEENCETQTASGSYREETPSNGKVRAGTTIPRRRFKVGEKDRFSVSPSNSRKSSSNCNSLYVTPVNMRKLGGVDQPKETFTAGITMNNLPSRSSIAGINGDLENNGSITTSVALMSHSNYSSSFDVDTLNEEFVSSSIGSSPADSMLSMSMTSSQFNCSFPDGGLKFASKSPETASITSKTSTTSKVFRHMKLPFLKKIKSRRSSTHGDDRSPEISSSRARSMYVENLSEATEILEKYKEDNETLSLEVRGKNEELNILNATLDHVNQTWENHMQALQKELENQKKKNEKLRTCLVKERTAHATASKPTIRVPMSEGTRKPLSNGNDSASHHNTDDSTVSASPQITPTVKRRGIRERKTGTAVETSSKTEHVREMLFLALSSSKCLSQLSEGSLQSIIDVMKSKRINKGERLMQEGALGQAFYVLQEGACKIYKQNQDSTSPNLTQGGRSVGQWEIIGEADVFYRTRRVLSCKCVRPGVVWFVTREEFKFAVMKQAIESRKKEVNSFLKTVKTFQKLDESQLRMIANFAKVTQYAEGDYITREGSHSSSVYVIKEGEVAFTKLVDGSETLTETLSAGEMFGNLDSQNSHQEHNAIATGKEVVQCLIIPGKYFNMVKDRTIVSSPTNDATPNKINGNIAHKIAKEDGQDSICSGYTESGSSGYGSDTNSPNIQRRPIKRPYYVKHAHDFIEKHKQLKETNTEDFEFIATIGKGAFGSVDLVASVHDDQDVYAIKKLLKEDVIASSQQQNVYNEKNLQMMTSRDCPFITSMYATFDDDRFVYFVMEYCPGGEIFSLLRLAKAFDDNSAWFYSACVIEALTFLHSRHIIFRDLKPENVVLDKNGYGKLTDFGFAKKVSTNSALRTYTYCGTPEYMAPETVLYNAQTFSVDLWSLGVFIFELLNGKAPFTSKNRAHLAQSILSGIEPKLQVACEANRISPSASSLIRELCQRLPEDRLGSGRNGIAEVTLHSWFQNFDWESLRRRSLASPWRPRLNNPRDLHYFETCSKSKVPVSKADDFSDWDEIF